jgi:SAM-dependent methyltransferase
MRLRNTSSIMPEAFRRRTRLTAILIALAAAAPSPIAAQQPAKRSPDIHPDIHFVPTSRGVADAMLKLANVTVSDVVYDLGSGDGRIVIAAAKNYGARGVGVELDPELIKTATKNARKAGVADKVTFIQGDLFKTDFSDATVVTLYLSDSINRRIAAILQRQLKPGARIVSHRFDMGDWKPEADVRLEGTHVLLWTIR